LAVLKTAFLVSRVQALAKLGYISDFEDYLFQILFQSIQKQQKWLIERWKILKETLLLGCFQIGKLKINMVVRRVARVFESRLIHG
jgi:hypothetical protein